MFNVQFSCDAHELLRLIHFTSRYCYRQSLGDTNSQDEEHLPYSAKSRGPEDSLLNTGTW